VKQETKIGFSLECFSGGFLWFLDKFCPPKPTGFFSGICPGVSTLVLPAERFVCSLDVSLKRRLTPRGWVVWPFTLLFLRFWWLENFVTVLKFLSKNAKFLGLETPHLGQIRRKIGILRTHLSEICRYLSVNKYFHHIQRVIKGSIQNLPLSFPWDIEAWIKFIFLAWSREGCLSLVLTNLRPIYW